MDMERFGTGIGKMKNLMKAHGLKEPTLAEEGDFFAVTFYGPGDNILDLVPSIPEERTTDLKKLGLNERQIEALRDLQGLVASGQVKSSGVQKGTKYSA